MCSQLKQILRRTIQFMKIKKRVFVRRERDSEANWNDRKTVNFVFRGFDFICSSSLMVLSSLESFVWFHISPKLFSIWKMFQPKLVCSQVTKSILFARTCDQFSVRSEIYACRFVSFLTVATSHSEFAMANCSPMTSCEQRRTRSYKHRN